MYLLILRAARERIVDCFAHTGFARQFNQKSEIGAYLDPMADKTLLVGTFIILAYEGSLPLWIVLLFVARDVLIVGGVLMASLMGREMTIAPLMVSKATTLFQILLAAWAFAAKAHGFDHGLIGDVLIAASAGLTLASAAAYANVWFRHMSGVED